MVSYHFIASKTFSAQDDKRSSLDSASWATARRRSVSTGGRNFDLLLHKVPRDTSTRYRASPSVSRGRMAAQVLHAAFTFAVYSFHFKNATERLRRTVAAATYPKKRRADFRAKNDESISSSPSRGKKRLKLLFIKHCSVPHKALKISKNVVQVNHSKLLDIQFFFSSFLFPKTFAAATLWLQK